MKSFIAVALVLATALPCRAQSYAYYPDDNTGTNYAAPAGWYPWFTNNTGCRLQILVPASALAGITGPITSIGGFLGNTGPTAGGTSVTFANFQVRISPAGSPALTNTFATNQVPGTETLVVNQQNLTMTVNPAGGWQDIPLSTPYTLPAGPIVIDWQSSIPVAGGQYFLSTVSSTVPRCVAATYTGQATGTLSTGSGSKVRLGYAPDNLFLATTTGGGTGDLSLSLTMITAGAVEGYMLPTASPVGPVGSGPFFGIWPSAITFDVVNTPPAPGNPLHFLVGFPGVYPDVPFGVPPGPLAFLAGQTWDLVVVVLGPGLTYVGKSSVQRLAW